MPLRADSGYGSAGAVRITAVGRGLKSAGASYGSSRNDFDIGDKVKVDYKRSGRFYRGKIMRKMNSGKYNILYDDGETENDVEESRIELIEKSETSRRRNENAYESQTEGTTNNIQEGSKVEANYRGRGRYYPGRVSRVRLNGTMDIDYDDGEKEIGVDRDNVRLAGGSSSPSRSSSDRIEEGSKVEANYRGRGRYYPGRVSRVRLNGTMDIDYDDGEKEIGVDRDNVRLAGGSSSPSRSSSDRIEEGSKVEANYRGRGRYYPGRVSRVRLNGTMDIDYDDGEKEIGVDRDNVRLAGGSSSPSRSSSDRIEEGSKVEANYRGRGRYYPGRVSRVRLNGTMDIDYDDGEKEIGVDRDNVRLAGGSSSPSRSSSDRIEEGSKVEANYRGRGRYYPGRVSRVRLNGTMDIDYDDGEKEVGVDRDNVRLAGGSSSPSRSSSDRIEEGSKVEVNYRGRGRYYPGRVSRVRLNGTMDIDYDDGEKEIGVDKDNVRLAGGSSSPSRSSSDRIEEGSKVEANYRGRGRYYPGRVSRVRLNGTMDIDYDDGEKEIGVDRDNVRLAGGSSSPSRSSSDRIEEGSKVEANYRGRGRYYPGRVSRVRLNGTMDIDYDDGEKEIGVDRDNVRLAGGSSSPSRSSLELRIASRRAPRSR